MRQNAVLCSNELIKSVMLMTCVVKRVLGRTIEETGVTGTSVFYKSEKKGPPFLKTCSVLFWI